MLGIEMEKSGINLRKFEKNLENLGKVRFSQNYDFSPFSSFVPFSQQVTLKNDVGVIGAPAAAFEANCYWRRSARKPSCFIDSFQLLQRSLLSSELFSRAGDPRIKTLNHTTVPQLMLFHAHKISCPTPRKLVHCELL